MALDLFCCVILDKRDERSGLNGGTIWERGNKADQYANDFKAERAPKCYRLKGKDGRDYQDEMIVMRVSNDGVYGGIYVSSNEILIYRFMAPNGDLLPDTSKTKQPVQVH